MVASDRNTGNRAAARSNQFWLLTLGFVSYQAVILPKLSDRDGQNPNAGDSLRKIYGNAEATQIQDILNRAIRNRQQIFLNYRPDLSKPKATVSSSN